MPVHDQGYRRYAGGRGRGGSWLVIAKATVRAEIRQKRVMALLLLAYLPFLVRAVLIYGAANFQQAQMLATTAQTFREFLSWQNIFVFFVTILIGAGLISEDRRANALQIYLSKPITRVEYIVGKLAVLFAFLVAVTWVPAMLLVLLQTLFSGSLAFVRDNLFVLPAITLVSLLQVFLSAFAMLALSSLSKSRRFVAMMYAGIIFFTAALNQALRGITGSRAWAWISPGDSLDVIGDAAFRLTDPRPIPLPVAVAVVAVIILASIVVLERRVRGVEVVA